MVSAVSPEPGKDLLKSGEDDEALASPVQEKGNQQEETLALCGGVADKRTSQLYGSKVETGFGQIRKQTSGAHKLSNFASGPKNRLVIENPSPTLTRSREVALCPSH